MNFAPKCQFNSSYACPGQFRGRRFLCPLNDPGFTNLLDFYSVGGHKDDAIPSPMDPWAIPALKCKEIACWFDNDFHALDIYCQWKITGELHMTPKLCREFRRAWCRYWTRLKPLSVQPNERPLWYGKSESRWKGISVEWGLGYARK